MKNIKIYWRLAFLLSLIPAIVWTIVWLINGDLPKLYLIYPFTWLSLLFPSWALSRWWDILGVFLFVLLFHNYKHILEKVLNATSKGVLAMSIIIFGRCIVVLGACIGTVTIISINTLLGFIVFMITVLLLAGSKYIANKIPEDIQEKTKNWIMQKDKEEKI